MACVFGLQTGYTEIIGSELICSPGYSLVDLKGYSFSSGIALYRLSTFPIGILAVWTTFASASTSIT